MSQVEKLRSLGFDMSYAIPFKHAWRIGCSQCQALFLYGIPTHEIGCPNRVSQDAREDDQ